MQNLKEALLKDYRKDVDFIVSAIKHTDDDIPALRKSIVTSLGTAMRLGKLVSPQQTNLYKLAEAVKLANSFDSFCELAAAIQPKKASPAKLVSFFDYDWDYDFDMPNWFLKKTGTYAKKNQKRSEKGTEQDIPIKPSVTPEDAEDRNGAIFIERLAKLEQSFLVSSGDIGNLVNRINDLEARVKALEESKPEIGKLDSIQLSEGTPIHFEFTIGRRQ